VNIGLANELADLCTVLQADPIELIDAAATKPFGFMPFYPGAGVGGHCIPVDPHYLLWQLRAHGVSLPIVEQAMAAIAERPHRTARRVLDALARHGIAARGSRALVVGVAYKAGVSDVRMSPAIEIMRHLTSFGVDVSFHDPLVEQIELDGELHRSLAPEFAPPFDVLVLHTPQPGSRPDAFAATVRVDCTYRDGSSALVGRRPDIVLDTLPDGDMIDLRAAPVDRGARAVESIAR
jgi:nucleotide sugar dehydrogenase